MQKHSDRIDKRPPITGGAANGMGLGADPYWPKLDAMSMYGYQQPLMDHPRLSELDSREHGYGSVWDPRNSSAFTALAPTATNSSPAENKTSTYDSFKSNGQVSSLTFFSERRKTTCLYLFFLCIVVKTKNLTTDFLSGDEIRIARFRAQHFTFPDKKLRLGQAFG